MVGPRSTAQLCRTHPQGEQWGLQSWPASRGPWQSQQEQGMGCSLLHATSRVLSLPDVTGGHVALFPMCLSQPPLPVACDVLKLQDPESLVS